MKYKVIKSKKFKKQYTTLSKDEQLQVDKIEKKLELNPYYGKALFSKFFREKKIGGKRMYYLIYQEVILVIIAAVSDKKTQKETIKMIKARLEEFRKLAKQYHEDQE